MKVKLIKKVKQEIEVDIIFPVYRELDLSDHYLNRVVYKIEYDRTLSIHVRQDGLETCYEAHVEYYDDINDCGHDLLDTNSRIEKDEFDKAFNVLIEFLNVHFVLPPK
jgi:hypothetical protein